MPALSRTLLCTVPAALMLVLMTAPVMPTAAVATPLPMPLQPNYAAVISPALYATRPRLAKKAHTSAAKHNLSTHGFSTTVAAQISSHHKNPHSGRKRQSEDQFDSYLSQLSGGRDNAVASSNNLQNLAAQSASSENDEQFQQDAAAQFSALHGTVSLVHNILGGLAADKGLANYDKRDQLETAVKDIVNANKNALSATNVMINNIPTLGPLLGPMVYDLKCLLDDILDVLENATDGIINELGLGSLFGGVASQANDMTCGSQLKVLGFCV